MMSKNDSVVVVGSGLSSLSAILALNEKGIYPDVYDIGGVISDEINKEMQTLAQKDPRNWDNEVKNKLINKLEYGSKFPRKTLFGSTFAYGESIDVNRPPHSVAKGGFSEVWGASALVTPEEELENWPVPKSKLDEYSKKILKYVPYASGSSQLDDKFKDLGNQTPIELTQFQRETLSKLKGLYVKDKFLIGESRLMIFTNENNSKSCKKCGFCMLGCAYGSIFKASFLINELISSGKIRYFGNSELFKISRNGAEWKLHFKNPLSNITFEADYQRVFIGIGATGTSEVILRSSNSINKVKIYGRGSLVIPLISLIKPMLNWPHDITLPKIFIEIFNSKFRCWTHIQLSFINEFIVKKLRYKFGENKVLSNLKENIISRISTLFINSNEYYQINYTIEKIGDKFLYERKKSGSLLLFVLVSIIKVWKISLKMRSVIIFPFIKLNTGTYHIGSSFPMRQERKEITDTNTVGELREFPGVHIIDASVFPSIPATTFGILLMSNSWRIVDEVTENVL